MLVEIRPAIAPPGQALLCRRDVIEVEFLHQKLRVIDAGQGHHGCAYGIDNHALADMPAAIFVASPIDGDDEDAALIGTAAQRELPRIFPEHRLAVSCGADG